MKVLFLLLQQIINVFKNHKLKLMMHKYFCVFNNLLELNAILIKHDWVFDQLLSI